MEGLHALEEAEQSQEHGLGPVLGGRGAASPGHRNSEVDEGEDEAEDVEVVPEVGEIGATSLALQFHRFDGEVPELDEEKRNDEERGAEEGGMEEEKEKPTQQEGVVKDKEPESVLPSLL